MSNLLLNGMEHALYQETVCQVAQEYGTPSFLFDKELFISRLNDFKRIAKDSFEPNGIKYDIQYAAKAFFCKSLAHLIDANGLNIDTCSLGEMMTAITAGVDGSRLGLHGNNKSDEELEYAIANDIQRIFVDNTAELTRLQTIAQKHNKMVTVFLRVITGVHAGGHEFISTGHEDQKFGLSLDASKSIIADFKLNSYPSLTFGGLHSHIGSQINSVDAFSENLQILLKFCDSIRSELNINITELNLGGGFGIQYTLEDDEIDLVALFGKLASQIINYAGGIKLSFEPGRWLIGPAMATVYRIGVIKDVEYAPGKMRRYISVDGGMSDNIRPALYDAKYICYTISNSNGQAAAGQSFIRGLCLAEHSVLGKNYKNCRIVGKHCESGDILINEVYLPDSIEAGDFIVIPCTGAYGYSMASNYNMLPKPAVIALTNGDSVRSTNARPAFSELIPRQKPEDYIV